MQTVMLTEAIAATAPSVRHAANTASVVCVCVFVSLHIVYHAHPKIDFNSKNELSRLI